MKDSLILLGFIKKTPFFSLFIVNNPKTGTKL